MNKRLKLLVSLLGLMFLLTACVPGDGSYSLDRPANIFSGIWHGWIAPFTLLLSIASGEITMYEVINTGFGYNFGFYMAIISGFGGLSLIRKK